MSFSFKNIDWTKKNGILIIGICLSAIFLDFLVQPYRGTWIFQYGSTISLVVFYSGIIWSLINTFQLVSENKSNIKNNLFWIFISAIPFLYILIIMTIAMTRNID